MSDFNSTHTNDQVEVINMNEHNIPLESVAADNDVNPAGPFNSAPEAQEEPESTAPEPLNFEDQIYKRRLLMKIQRYYESFPQYFPAYNAQEIEIQNIEQLESTLKELKYIVGVRNANENIIEGFKAGCWAIESVGSKFMGLNLNGYTQMTITDPNIINTVKEISLEYDELCYVRAEYRLAYNMIRNAAFCHMINSAAAKSEIKSTEQVPPQKTEEYKDL